MIKLPLHPLFLAAQARPGGDPLLALITGRRRTGHGVVTITRNGRTHQYKVGLKRYRTLSLAIIRMPWREGGRDYWQAFDLYLYDRPKAFREPVQFRGCPRI